MSERLFLTRFMKLLIIIFTDLDFVIKIYLYLPIFVKTKQSTLKTIGNTLRELREEKGLLLREVGAKLSIDPTILSKIEQDKRMPTKEQVKALGDFFKHKKNEVIIAWLSDKLFYEVQSESLALEAMQVAEEKIKYNIKEKRKYYDRV